MAFGTWKCMLPIFSAFNREKCVRTKRRVSAADRTRPPTSTATNRPTSLLSLHCISETSQFSISQCERPRNYPPTLIKKASCSNDLYRPENDPTSPGDDLISPEQPATVPPAQARSYASPSASRSHSLSAQLSSCQTVVRCHW